MSRWSEKRRRRARIDDESGVITVDFMFAIITAGAFTALLFSMSYALCVVEVTQYVMFSTARAYIASNKDYSAQTEAARLKYTNLTVGNGPIASLYATSWFTLSKPDQLDIRGGYGGGDKQFSEDLAGGSDAENRNWFQGVSTELTLGILAFSVPGLGATYENDESDFKTRVNAILIRESTQQECRDFIEARRAAIGRLSSGGRYYQPSAYVPMEDNGC